MKNKHCSKAIQDAMWYFFRQCLEYKSQFSGVELKLANRFFPSSKKCSKCGSVKKFLSLNERTYICKCCGFICDRDLNAAYNLRDLAFSQ